MSLFKSAKAIAGAALFTVATLGAAHAATVTFTFGGAAPTGTSEVYSAGGIDLTVTAFGGNVTRFSNDAIGVGPNSTFSGTEIGALMYGDETLTFGFNPSVNLIDALVFESGTGTDTVEITNLGSGSTMQFDVVNTDPGNGNSGTKLFRFDLATIDPSFDRNGSSFMFQTFSSSGSNQGVAIKEVTVSSISPVPVPAALPLMLVGVGAFGIARRRKSA